MDLEVMRKLSGFWKVIDLLRTREKSQNRKQLVIK